MNTTNVTTSNATDVQRRHDADRHATSATRRRWARAVVAVAAMVGAVASAAAISPSTASAAAPEYCYSHSWSSNYRNAGGYGTHAYGVTDNVTVCIRWNYTYGQYRISNWSQNQRHSSGFGWEFVDWSGSYKTGGRNHLAFNSIVVGNFKSCIGIWVVSGCVRNTKAWTRITFQITNPATGAAQWYRSQG